MYVHVYCTPSDEQKLDYEINHPIKCNKNKWFYKLNTICLSLGFKNILDFLANYIIIHIDSDDSRKKQHTEH